MSKISTPAQRAHLRCCMKLADSITTHSAPIPPESRSGYHPNSLAELQRRGRNGRAAGPKARVRP